ncbi:hypothetical protein ACFGVR_15000 [Mucilaginibacter sp. AW1-3]
MTNQTYTQIITLKNERDDIKRGRLFEALIREIMPWDHRPPIVMSPTSEQLDGVFVYKGTTFLIECKAVKSAITPGSKEWEDFELKLRKRERQNIIGLFCSLYDVSPKTIEHAELMNKTGIQTILIAGKIWDELYQDNLYFPSFLDFLVLNCKIKFHSTVSSLNDAKKWVYDTQTIDERFSSVCKKFSAPFLRRFKHKYHDKIFIDRNIDKQIRNFTSVLNPTGLRANPLRDPKQIIIIRDYSGSGKTTLSTQLATLTDFAYCLASTANLTTIDELLDPFFNQVNYPHFAINELLAVNKPILFIVDSLDETPLNDQVQKRREIKSLLKRIEELNAEAAKFKLAVYPVVLMFTVREEYWRDWEAAFEGRKDVVELKKMISNFTETELQKALGSYSAAYDYTILNNLNQQAAAILSIPINLEIFSEANHFEGDINIYEIWEGKILNSFFNKKEDLINKHYIDRFNADTFYRILGLVAFELLKTKTTLISKTGFRKIVSSVSSELVLSSDKLLLQLVSEQIITNDTEDNKNFRFKYLRFIEYLSALFIIHEVERYGEYDLIDDFIRIIYDSNIVSIFSVFNNLKHIAQTNYSEIEEQIINHYAQSSAYLSRYLPELRGRIGRGEFVSDEDIKSVLTSTYTPSAFNSWHTFFIVSANQQKVSKDNIISAFLMAWENNHYNTRRWQLIKNLGKRRLLVTEQILITLLKDGNPREWEEYLGQILEKKDNGTFMDLWTQIGGEKALGQLSHNNPSDWQITNRFLDLIARNEGYVLGDIMADLPANEYTVFVPKKTIKQFQLNENDKHLLDDFIIQVKLCVDDAPTKMMPLATRLNEMGKDAEQYLNQELDDYLNGFFGADQKPFINQIVSRQAKSYVTIKTILDTTLLHFDLQSKDQRGNTAFIEIIAETDDIISFLESLFKRGYRKCVEDEQFLLKQIDEQESLGADRLEAVLLGFVFTKLTNTTDYSIIGKIHKELMILFSFRFGRILSSRFPNMVQVVNNAFQHYPEFSRLFIRALHVYNLFEEMEKVSSVKKKISAFEARSTPQNQQYDHVFEAIFPLLFQ